MNEWIRNLASVIGVAYLFYYLWTRWARFNRNRKEYIPRS